MIQKNFKSSLLFCTTSLQAAWVLLTFIIVLSGTYAFSQNSITSFSPGAYIIDMGQNVQTIGNGIKPYGLVYQLIAVDGFLSTGRSNLQKLKTALILLLTQRVTVGVLLS